MLQVDLHADRRRLFCDVLIRRPDSQTDFSGFRGRGLIDTGATISGIGPAAIKALGLRSYGKKPLGSATEEKMVDYYLFQIAFEQQEPTGAPQWPYLFDRIDGFSWNRNTEFDVIVGMDILLDCHLHLARGGACRLSFG